MKTRVKNRNMKPLTPLKPEERREACDAFHALLDAPDDGRLAVATVVTLQSLKDQKQRQGGRICRKPIPSKFLARDSMYLV